MAENNKDGYVQHANVGRRSIIDIDEANSNFEVVGDKITGIVKGSITKEYQGNTDIFQLNLNNIPFIGGGGSGGSNVAQYWVAADSIYWPESTDSSYPFNDVYHVFKSRPTVTVHEIPDVSDLELIWGDAEALTTDESILSDINDGKMIVFSMIEYLRVYDSSTDTSTWQYQVQPPRLVTTYYDNTSAGDLVSHYYSFPNAAYNPHGGYGNMASNTIVYAHYKDTGTTNWNYIRG